MSIISENSIENRDASGSGELDDIIINKPGFIEVYALILFFILFVGIILASWFIRYPEIIRSIAFLNATDAPKDIVVREEGKLESLMVSNFSDVKKDEIIGWVESNADHKAVLKLSVMLSDGLKYLQNNETNKVAKLFEDSLGNLGELQPAFQEFVIARLLFNDHFYNSYYNGRRILLTSDYKKLVEIHELLLQEKDIDKLDLELNKESLVANDSLLKLKIISKQDFREQKSKQLSKELNYRQLVTSLFINENLQNDKRKEILELEHSFSQQKDIFFEAIQKLKNSVDDWLRRYSIRSVIDGKIEFNSAVQENQFLQAGKSIGFVYPKSNEFYALLSLPQFNLGEVSIGQQVQLQFDSYPFQKYGYVEGEVANISDIISDSGFVAKVTLIKGLETNYNIDIKYRYGLRAQALIATRNSRLLSRLFYELRKLISR